MFIPVYERPQGEFSAVFSVDKKRSDEFKLALGRGALAKRILDISIAGIALLMLLPFLPLIALLIKLDSPGAVFFRQTRVGLNGTPFAMWKLRSMYVDAERRKTQLADQNQVADGVLFKMKRDPRITRIGRFLRKGSIDELPQLWNVFIGDMSLVGPRPALPKEVAQYDECARQRLRVKPGITCLWQISGRSLLSFSQQVDLDLAYIRKQSLLLDMTILFKTVPAVVTGHGAF